METRKQTLIIGTSDGSIVVCVESIIHVVADGSYSKLVVDDGTHHHVCRNIGSLEAELPGDLFFRCHDSHLMHIGKVVKLHNGDGHTAEMINGERINISRRKMPALMSALRGEGSQRK
jgi:two-component system, LytTR family, response regulator